MNMLPHFDELANAYKEDEEDDVEVIERGQRPLAHGSEVSSARGSQSKKGLLMYSSLPIRTLLCKIEKPKENKQELMQMIRIEKN
ncbi:hypothetical protein CKAN_00914900 [Cinnamomum micranthum f. kanehirae]|uniref:Uncharacterized protein n=1 Tax=Cinnamomum micranthum f. kanehirae TaxID=337451 RepID=A0A3S3MQC0_9MAGN|nr:hypothetical protein CKAN_00914900 [Cinnamomum micranthum f. kanehirae]